MPTKPFQDGKILFKIDERDKPCETYYKIYGDLHSEVSPLVILHGGVGSGHEYLEPYCKIWERYGIPVVFYDQIGCAASTHLREMDYSFWQPSVFVAELQNLLDHLSIGKTDGPGYYLMGHSWGANLAIAFVANRQPPRLRKLILGGGNADSQLFKKNLWELLEGFPKIHQEAVKNAIQQDDFTSQSYLDARMHFAKTYTCRADPWPPEMLMSNKHQAEDPTTRRAMQGRCIWLYDGTLEHYSSIPLLPKIKASTLVFNSEFDTARDNMMHIFTEHIPKVRWVKFPGAAHMIHLDSPELLEKCLKLVGEFIQEKDE